MWSSFVVRTSSRSVIPTMGTKIVRRTTLIMGMALTTATAAAAAVTVTGVSDDQDCGTRRASFPVTSCEASTSSPPPPPPPTNNSRRHPSRLRRKQTTLQQATESTVHSGLPATRQSSSPSPSPSSSSSSLLNRFTTRREIERLQAQEMEMLLRWERDEDGWRDLPARAWPAYQPSPEQLKDIEGKIQQHHCRSVVTSSSSTSSSSSEECTEWLFQAATSLVFYNLDPHKGLKQYEQLAHRGHVDSMVACGVILVEGMGVPVSREDEGIQWLQKAVDLDSPQACYELGTMYYTGIDGVLEEDPCMAFELFLRASQHDHTGGLYMVADCLLEGEGTDRNVGRAIPLLYRAAERGHRFARQRIRELLATYSSRPM